MQEDMSTVHGGGEFISSNGVKYRSLYSPFSPLNSPSSCTTPISSKTIARSLEFSSSPHSALIQEQQDLVNSHGLCFTHLREATKEAEVLRLENTALRLVNRDLTKRFSEVIQTSLQKKLMPSDCMINEFRGLCMDHKKRATGAENNLSRGDHPYVQSPVIVIDKHKDLAVERNLGAERVSLPKSISVRSNGYMKMNNGLGNVNHGGQTRNLNRTRTANPPISAQRVYVRGGKKEGDAVELEAYNQGMLKTELCNKWQETGTCPYSNNCQYAHGIEELRPVLRHPRYKTEVCRMVLVGDPCPYGHRCHFRHALTNEEKLVAAAANPRAVKLNR